MKSKIPTPPAPIPEPPPHLSSQAVELWRELGAKAADTPGRRVMFTSALEALDRAEQARKVVTAEGLTKTNGEGKMQHVHPAVTIELQSRKQFSKLWEQLGLGSTNGDKPSRRDPYAKFGL